MMAMGIIRAAMPRTAAAKNAELASALRKDTATTGVKGASFSVPAAIANAAVNSVVVASASTVVVLGAVVSGLTYMGEKLTGKKKN